jgi:hypothetical protein
MEKCVVANRKKGGGFFNYFPKSTILLEVI